MLALSPSLAAQLLHRLHTRLALLTGRLRARLGMPPAGREASVREEVVQRIYIFCVSRVLYTTKSCSLSQMVYLIPKCQRGCSL